MTFNFFISTNRSTASRHFSSILQQLMVALKVLTSGCNCTWHIRFINSIAFLHASRINTKALMVRWKLTVFGWSWESFDWKAEGQKMDLLENNFVCLFYLVFGWNFCWNLASFADSFPCILTNSISTGNTPHVSNTKFAALSSSLI